MYYHPQTGSYFNNQPEKRLYFHFDFPINSYKQLLYFYQNL